MKARLGGDYVASGKSTLAALVVSSCEKSEVLFMTAFKYYSSCVGKLWYKVKVKIMGFRVKMA